MASSATTSSGATGTGDTATIVARGAKLIDISVSGIVAGDTVALERSPDGATTWYVVESYAADTQKVAQNAGIKDMRLQRTAHTGGGTVIMTIRAGNAY